MNEIKIKKKFFSPIYLVLILLISISVIFIILKNNKISYSSIKVEDGTKFSLSTHFDSYNNWENAIKTVVDNPGNKMIGSVGIGAGRVNWVYFKWDAHKDKWSNSQKNESRDMFFTAVTQFNKKGWDVIAIIDLFDPRYISNFPKTAAIGFDGKKSESQLCFTELTNGKFSLLLEEMVSYVLKKYNISAINFTELNYYSYCYCDNCLKSYKKWTGKKKWPRNWFSRNVSRDHLSIGKWRSSIMSNFLKKIHNVTKKHNKELYVDVPVSWDNFNKNAVESGLDYNLVLASADKIILWNYFHLKGEDPEISKSLSKYMTDNFNKKRVILSIGLWGDNTTSLSPYETTVSAYHTLKGGITNIWITPNHLLTKDHWKELEVVFRFPVN
jgi:hypothetical protein